MNDGVYTCTIKPVKPDKPVKPVKPAKSVSLENL